MKGINPKIHTNLSYPILNYVLEIKTYDKPLGIVNSQMANTPDNIGRIRHKEDGITKHLRGRKDLNPFCPPLTYA